MSPVEKTKLANYVELSTETFFWRTLDCPVDDAYGRAPYAPALAQVLSDIALIQDLRDAVHNSAWPRLGHGFNFTEMFKVAQETFNMVDPNAAAAWVKDQFDSAVAAVADMRPDDNVFYDSNGRLEILEGGKGLAQVEHILTFLRQRVVQSLKSLPTLMGINDGSTQTYTTVEWQIYAAGLETLRDQAVDLLERAADLHLRLKGLALRADSIVKKIRTSDALIDAQAEAKQIENAITKIRMGWITNEEAAISITGSGPVAEPMPGALDNPQKQDPKVTKQ